MLDLFLFRGLIAVVSLLIADLTPVPPLHGPYDVGVSSTLIADSTRIVEGRARPIQITTWYPARPSPATRVTYAHYLDLAFSEKQPASDSSVTAGRSAFSAFLVKAGMSQSDVETWLETRMLASPNVTAASGRFPLIIIVQGNGQSAGDQSTLAEYLASCGFVVATIPSYTRISRPPASEAEIGPGSEEQADDIEIVVRHLRRQSNVSPASLGIVAHSLGARGALLYAMRDNGVGALVSLDGGIGTATARSVMEGSPSFSTQSIDTPVLHLYGTIDAFMAPDFTLLRELRRSDVQVVRVTGLHHHHFTDIGAWTGRVPGLAKATGATTDTAPSYQMMMSLTRAFLDARLKGNASAFTAARKLSSVSRRNRPAFRFERLVKPTG